MQNTKLCRVRVSNKPPCGNYWRFTVKNFNEVCFLLPKRQTFHWFDSISLSEALPGQAEPRGRGRGQRNNEQPSSLGSTGLRFPSPWSRKRDTKLGLQISCKYAQPWGCISATLQPAQRAWRVCHLRDIQTASGHGPAQPAWGGPAWTAGLDPMTSWGPSQTQSDWFCSTSVSQSLFSINTWCSSICPSNAKWHTQTQCTFQRQKSSTRPALIKNACHW